MVFGQQPDSQFPESAPSFEEISFPTEGTKKIPAHFRARLRSLTTNYGRVEKTIRSQVLFSDNDLTLSYIYPTYCNTVLSLSLGYEYTLYAQNTHMFSHQESFHNGFGALGIQNNSFRKTTLFGEVSTYTNLENCCSDSTLVYVTGYGTYLLRPCLGISLGAIYRGGISSNRVWPIAGIEWQISKTWELNFVYPIDMALIYHLNSCWSFSCNGRLINNRQRLKNNDAVSSGFLQYENFGVELDATYEWESILFTQLGLGYLLAGKFSSSHRNYDQENVPFVNFQFALRF